MHPKHAWAETLVRTLEAGGTLPRSPSASFLTPSPELQFSDIPRVSNARSKPNFPLQKTLKITSGLA